jgi:prepilin-type N-terminal cleavage/methylation domain-containing protein
MKSRMKFSSRSDLASRAGFTLIELLIVIAVIAILAGVVFVALDPLTRFRDARNARRATDVSNILTAIKVDQVDHGGTYVFSGLVAPNNYIIGTNGATGCNTGCSAVTTQNNCVDLTLLQTRGYLGTLPLDPQSGTAAKTGYYIRSNTNNSVAIGACTTEGAAAIEITQ